jgi:Holliday junction resolvase RusA-like endonuclease
MHELSKIKAIDFFEALESGNYFDGFEQIYDLYFEAISDPKMQMVLKQQNLINSLSFKLQMCVIIINHLAESKLTEQDRIEICTELRKSGLNIRLKDFEGSIKQVVGNLKMQLKIESESIPKNTQKVSFHKQLVDLENILKRNIPEDISLAKFIELQKSIKNVTK